VKTEPTLEEDLPSIWRRRALSIPGLLILTALGPLLTPLALVLFLVRDLVRLDLRMPGARAWLALVTNLVVHTTALFWLAWAWLTTEALRGDKAADARESYRVEAILSRGIIKIITRLFGAKLEVEGLDELGPEPNIILARHASVLDPLLVLAVTWPRGARVRWVAKRELLWDPCIDILGHRFPTAFVWRKGRAPKRDLKAVTRLVDHLEDHDAVLLFPEGTRHSEEKKARAIAPRAEGPVARRARASAQARSAAAPRGHPDDAAPGSRRRRRRLRPRGPRGAQPHQGLLRRSADRDDHQGQAVAHQARGHPDGQGR
jgi:1-acyl-sn-glycerol-3-phosphate acyltransferase